MSIDYEKSQRMRLIVIAMLSSDNSFDFATVWVNVLDVNDNAPDFGQDRLTTAVWEGNPRGTFVVQLLASDADSNDNGIVSYSIIGGNTGSAFIINPAVTGIVTTNVMLDREFAPMYLLKIQAVDKGNPPLSSTCTLRINVIDINDNTPNFPVYAPINVNESKCKYV